MHNIKILKLQNVLFLLSHEKTQHNISPINGWYFMYTLYTSLIYIFMFVIKYRLNYNGLALFVSFILISNFIITCVNIIHHLFRYILHLFRVIHRFENNSSVFFQVRVFVISQLCLALPLCSIHLDFNLIMPVQSQGNDSS